MGWEDVCWRVETQGSSVYMRYVEPLGHLLARTKRGESSWKGGPSGGMGKAAAYWYRDMKH